MAPFMNVLLILERWDNMNEIMMFFVVFNIVFTVVFLVSSNAFCLRSEGGTCRKITVRWSAIYACAVFLIIIAAEFILSAIVGSAFDEFLNVIGSF